MWVSKGRLPHVLAPAAYHSAEQHRREQEALFLPGWHPIASHAELRQHGDYVARELLGTQVLLRNDRGVVRAFVNACAHRHAQLLDAGCGKAHKLRCRYHGWEYDGAGAVSKIPDAACFVPVRRGSERLSPLRTQALGGVHFVSLASEGPDLRASLGEATWALGERIFSTRSLQAVHDTFEHPCNWKIPIENVLESYHVPSLHNNWLARNPELFKVFGGKRRGDASVVHELGEGYSSYHDSLGADSRAYTALIRALSPEATADYVHHHGCPHMVFGHTSIVSFVQVVLPRTATSSYSRIWLFLDTSARRAPMLGRALSPVLAGVASRLIRMVLAEDAAVYPDVQRGLEASPHVGVLAAREERVHHFQEYVAQRAGGRGAPMPTGGIHAR
jgi:phenylpropionate dioxygenase-like ring-hydroxylating dioxygenase large terminal subunit